jgi:ABC-type uncharacterized transport system auxiliary subunit
MRRRDVLRVLPALLTACGLSERPYAERRAWPLLVPRPAVLPPAAGGGVLLLRSIAAAPGLELRGLQSLRPDGSIRTEFYEEWAVPPAEGVEQALRQWLADCGMFAAVVAPGSRVPADIVLEGELTALWSIPAEHRAHAALAFTALLQQGRVSSLRLQQTVAADAPLPAPGAPAAAQAMRAALATDFAGVEVLLRSCCSVPPAGPAGL